MQVQARRTAESADLLISVIESLGSPPDPVDIGRSPDIRVRTKMDLCGNLSANEIGICALDCKRKSAMDQLRRRNTGPTRLRRGRGSGGTTLSLNAPPSPGAIAETRATALDRALADSTTGHEWIALHLRESLSRIISARSPAPFLPTMSCSGKFSANSALENNAIHRCFSLSISSKPRRGSSNSGLIPQCHAR